MRAPDRDYRWGKLHLLFVYGTMKRGFINHSRLKKAEFISSTTTQDPVYGMMTKMVDSAHRGIYWAPEVFHIPVGDRIAGEVYAVPGPELFHIDMAEGHPDTYRRTEIFVNGIDGPVWAYLGDRSKTKCDSWRGIVQLNGIVEFQNG